MGFFGDLVGGILSLPGTIVGALNGSTATNALTEELARDQMDWQSEEAKLNREFQERTQQQQNDWNEMMWNKTNQWNSPATQVNLMRQAGLNPAALLSSGSASVSGSASSPSASQGAAGAMPGSPSVPHFVNNDAIGGLVSIASVMKSLGEAKKLGAETNQIETLLSHQVQNYILKNKDIEWSNEIKQADAFVSKRIKDVRVKKAFQELVNMQQQALNTVADTDYKKAQAAGERLGWLLTEEHINLTKQQVQELGIRNRNLQRVFDSQFATARSEQTKNYASARDLNASADGKELVNNIKRASNLTDIENELFKSSTLEFFRTAIDKEQLYQQLQREIYASGSYKGDDGTKEVETLLERFTRMIGLNVNVGASGTYKND